MDKKRGAYLIIIILLLVGIGCVVLYKMKKQPHEENKDNNGNIIEPEKNNESNTKEESTSYDEEITARHVDNIDGFEVYSYTKSLNGKDASIKISFNTKNGKENVNGEETDRPYVIYQIYLNDYLVNGASGNYYFDSGSEADAFAVDIKDTDIKLIKGLEGKEYLVLAFNTPNINDGTFKQNIFIINEFSRLIGTLTNDKFILMHKLDGTGDEKFLNNNEYNYYVISDNKINYLVSNTKYEDNLTSVNYTEYELTIKNHKITSSKKNNYVASDFEDGDAISSFVLKEY